MARDTGDTRGDRLKAEMKANIGRRKAQGRARKISTDGEARDTHPDEREDDSDD